MVPSNTLLTRQVRQTTLSHQQYAHAKDFVFVFVMSLAGQWLYFWHFSSQPPPPQILAQRTTSLEYLDQRYKIETPKWLSSHVHCDIYGAVDGAGGGQTSLWLHQESFLHWTFFLRWNLFFILNWKENRLNVFLQTLWKKKLCSNLFALVVWPLRVCTRIVSDAFQSGSMGCCSQYTPT